MVHAADKPQAQEPRRTGAATGLAAILHLRMALRQGGYSLGDAEQGPAVDFGADRGVGGGVLAAGFAVTPDPLQRAGIGEGRRSVNLRSFRMASRACTIAWTASMRILARE